MFAILISTACGWSPNHVGVSSGICTVNENLQSVLFHQIVVPSLHTLQRCVTYSTSAVAHATASVLTILRCAVLCVSSFAFLLGMDSVTAVIVCFILVGMIATRKGSLDEYKSVALMTRFLPRACAVKCQLFASRRCGEWQTVGNGEMSPPVSDIPGSILNSRNQFQTYKIDTASADTHVPAVGAKTPSLCLFGHEDRMVHFSGSVPRYLTAAMNDGKGAMVTMCPLKHKVRIDNAFGGPMTHHKDADGNRVPTSSVRRGTVRGGRVSCDDDGRINARILHNSRVRAVAAAKKLFHEVHGRADNF